LCACAGPSHSQWRAESACASLVLVRLRRCYAPRWGTCPISLYSRHRRTVMRTGPGACDLSSPSRANYLPNHKRLYRAIDSSHVDRTGTVTPRLLSRQTSADTRMYSRHARASRGLSRREWHVSSTACVTRPPSIRALNLVPAHDRSRYGSKHTGHLTAARLDA